MNNIDLIKYEKFSGLLYNALYFCNRKVFLEYNKILIDKGNLDIIEGQIQQENFNKEEEFKIGNIAIDKIVGNILYEHKKSTGNKLGAISQIRLYLFLLNELYNIKIEKGILNVGEKNIDKEEIDYTNKNKELFLGDYIKINIIVNGNIPPKNVFEKCKKCSFFEKCNI